MSGWDWGFPVLELYWALGEEADALVLLLPISVVFTLAGSVTDVAELAEQNQVELEQVLALSTSIRMYLQYIAIVRKVGCVLLSFTVTYQKFFGLTI